MTHITSKASKTAFNEVRVAVLFPVLQMSFLYNLNTNIVTTVVTGSGFVGQADSKAQASTSATINSSARIESKKVVKYKPGQGCAVRFTALYTLGVANSTQMVGIGDDMDGLIFGYNGDTFGILHRRNSVDTWIPQSTWSADKADGTSLLPIIDFTKGNVFEIKFQWLGFGGIEFYIEDPVSGKFTLVHIIEYANANTVPSLFNPSLPLFLEAINTANTSNLVVQASSLAGFVEGEYAPDGPRRSVGNFKVSVGTTLTNILTIRSRSLFAGLINKVPVFVDLLSAATEGTKTVEIQIIKNATLGGSPSYVDIDENTSTIDYDVAGTTLTGGVLLFTIELGKADSKDLQLLGKQVIEMFRDDTVTLAAKASSGTTEVTVGASWVEDF